jgi:deoxycytidine triphosphate deaminase
VLLSDRELEAAIDDGRLVMDPYGSRYQGQRGPTPSKSYVNFSKAALPDEK